MTPKEKLKEMSEANLWAIYARLCEMENGSVVAHSLDEAYDKRRVIINRKESVSKELDSRSKNFSNPNSMEWIKKKLKQLFCFHEVENWRRRDKWVGYTYTHWQEGTCKKCGSICTKDENSFEHYTDSMSDTY